MKKALLLTLILSTTFLVSCRKNWWSPDHVLNRKIVGEYSFKKVVANEGLFNRRNVTQDYNNMILQLNDRNEAAIIDQSNNITYLGDWHLIEDYVGTDDDGNSNTNYTITIDVDAGRGNRISLIGSNAYIGYHKLVFFVKKADGRYRYRLDKI